MFDFLKKKNSLEDIQNNLNTLHEQPQQDNSFNAMHNPMTQEIGFTQQNNSENLPEQNKFAQPDNFGSSQTNNFDPYNAQHFNQNYEEEKPVVENKQNLQNHDGHKHNQEVILKSLEVLNSKLDTIRISIESLNQRLVNLERIAAGEEQKRTW